MLSVVVVAVVVDDVVVTEGLGCCCNLVGDLVSPLLHGLHHLLDDGGLGDLPDGRGHVGGGLGEAEAVAHSGGDIVGIGHVSGGSGHGGGSDGGSSIGGGGSGHTSGVGVGQGSVKEDLGLGSGGGKSENNLKGVE